MSRVILIMLILSASVENVDCVEKKQLTKLDIANQKSLVSIHQTLDKAKVENDVHDACISLIQIGDETSIPHLIAALRFFSDEEPEPNEGMICTQVHCVEALKRITGENVGFSQPSWKLWYASRK